MLRFEILGGDPNVIRELYGGDTLLALSYHFTVHGVIDCLVDDTIKNWKAKLRIATLLTPCRQDR